MDLWLNHNQCVDGTTTSYVVKTSDYRTICPTLVLGLEILNKLTHFLVQNLSDAFSLKWFC